MEKEKKMEKRVEDQNIQAGIMCTLIKDENGN